MNPNGYSPLGHGYDQDQDDPASPPPYTLTSEAPSSPYPPSPHQSTHQYTGPSAPPAPSPSASSSSTNPRLYPQLHNQQVTQSSIISPTPQSPHQHHQYHQQHQPKSPYQAIPTHEHSYQYQHQPQHQQPQHQPYYHPYPHQHQHHQQVAHSPQAQRHLGPAPVATSPLVLARPPTRIEDLKARPGVVVCPCCHHLVLTETSTENGSCTYIGILALCLAGITSCGCCLFPLCMTSCKDIVHSCPNCQEEVGVYSRARARTIPV
ncbi:MAG: LITAF-like zinc ribbon domain-containing protein [Linnemannia elongata]|nr:MAG: LITAF-like zinc ribbon domain-containing protein [Linnemannia elongata]